VLRLRRTTCSRWLPPPCSCKGGPSRLLDGQVNIDFDQISSVAASSQRLSQLVSQVQPAMALAVCVAGPRCHTTSCRAACQAASACSGAPVVTEPGWRQRRWHRAATASGTDTSLPTSQQTSSSKPDTSHTMQQCATPRGLRRRALLAAAAAVAVGVSAPVRPAAASKLPEALDRAWVGLGGGPADLVFPGEPARLPAYPLGCACSGSQMWRRIFPKP
jgi:hypothetical protein